MRRGKSERAPNPKGVGRSGRRIQTFKEFSVHDDACGMKVGTDALLLGGWAGGTAEDDGRRVKSILDIGTGSGILALMLAQRFPEAQIDAIELEPEAAQQAQDNINRSPYADRIQVHVRAAQGWDTRVDLAVCNPPFFHGHPKSEDRKRNLARHDDTLPLRTLLRTAKACLNEGGEFAMVFPEDRANELIATAEEVGLHLHAKVALRATSAHDVIRSLWSWRLHPSSRTTQDTWEIEGPKGQGEWSATVQALLSPFV